MKIMRPYTNACNRISKVVPPNQRKSFYKLLEYAGIEDDYDVWLGKRILLSVLLGLIGMLLPWVAYGYTELLPEFPRFLVYVSNNQALSFGLYPIILSVVGLLLFSITAFFMFYLRVYYRAEARTSWVETVLPDFLLLVASNINSGMTPFSAFRNSARKEFGPLSDEIKIATNRSLGSQSFTGALSSLSKRIKSRYLSEAVEFFSQALKSGGKLSQLLEVTSKELRETEEIKKEILSATRMYMIFVVFVIVIANPLLAAISIQFLGMIEKIQSENAVTSTGEFAELGFLGGELSITSDFMGIVAIILLIGNSLMASLFMGVLSSRDEKMGLKYFPVLLIVSSIVFVIISNLLARFFA